MIHALLDQLLSFFIAIKTAEEFLLIAATTVDRLHVISSRSLEVCDQYVHRSKFQQTKGQGWIYSSGHAYRPKMNISMSDHEYKQNYGTGIGAPID